MSEARFTARYTIETAFGLEETAASMAGEQSTGTFLKLSSDDDPRVQRQAASVVRVVHTGDASAPSLPGAAVPKGATSVWRRGEVVLSWPLDTIGASLPNLLATVAGNLFELQQLSAIRLRELSLPRAFLDRYPGPAFGVEGTRRLAGVQRVPLLGTIIKPSVGLDAEQTAEIVAQLVDGGIDFIKDDELQSDGAFCPFEKRVAAVMRVVNDRAQRNGRKAMVAFNVTGEIDEMQRRHDIVARHDGTCVMASLNSVGLSGFTALRRISSLPIHAHRNGWGLFYRSPHIGIDYRAWSTLWRIAGADHMHVNGLRNKFSETDESSIDSARSLLEPMFPDRAATAMPVFSSGQWAGQAGETFARLGSADLIYACGGGIAGHPDGIAAGVESVRAAWEAAIEGEPVTQRAERTPALATALSFFGGLRS
ncbi:MAG: ribulose-bisphosphate carboxylase large subunit family protein [Janthinobacterium lividum]